MPTFQSFDESRQESICNLQDMPLKRTSLTSFESAKQDSTNDLQLKIGRNSSCHQFEPLGLSKIRTNLEQYRNNKKSFFSKIDEMLTQISNEARDSRSPNGYTFKSSDIRRLDYIIKKGFYSNWYDVKNFFQSIKTSNPQNHPSIKIMLAYREQVVHDVLTKVKVELGEEILKEKVKFLKQNNIDDSNPLYLKFINMPLEPLSWSDAGSKDPTSDIDVTLKGDFTQLAVKLFNHEMSSRFDNKEPGVTFDANVYSEYGIPDINKEDFASNARQDYFNIKHPESGKLTNEQMEKILKENETETFYYNTYLSLSKKAKRYPKYIDLNEERFKGVKEKLDIVKDPKLKQENLKNFELASLVKIRRYMSQGEWDYFSIALAGGFKNAGLDYEEILKRTVSVEMRYFNHIKELSAKIKKIQKDKYLYTILADEPAKSSYAGKSEEYLNIHRKNEEYVHKFPQYFIMEAENRLYEDKLLKVAWIKMKIDLYDLVHPSPKDTNFRDKLFLELEDAQCDAKYFANEAYVTTSSLLSVVMNKQILSRGLDAKKLVKDKYAKIPLSPHEHIISLNEQLGEFFKEATRSLNSRNPLGLEEAVGIKSGKYIHRFGNSYQHLYETLDMSHKMCLTKEQLKACTQLEALKKDPRPLVGKSRELRYFINKIFYPESGEGMRWKSKPEPHSPKEELKYFKKILISLTVQAYVDFYKDYQEKK